MEVIIYAKTQKYPDRYLNYLANLNDSGMEVGGLIARLGEARQVARSKHEIVKHVYMKVIRLTRIQSSLSSTLQLMKSMSQISKFKQQSQSRNSNSDTQTITSIQHS